MLAPVKPMYKRHEYMVSKAKIRLIIRIPKRKNITKTLRKGK